MKIPDSITKRDLLFGARKARPDDFLALAEEYYKLGQWSDAIDFFLKAEAKDRMSALAKDLVAEGETFLLLKLSRSDSSLVTDDQLLACAQKAESLGKVRYAILAHEKLGDSAKAESLRDTIANDGDIIAAREAEAFLSVHQEEISPNEEDEDTP